MIIISVGRVVAHSIKPISLWYAHHEEDNLLMHAFNILGNLVKTFGGENLTKY